MSQVKGVHVLIALLAFFGITIGVNAVFVTYALDTFTGEDRPKPYLEGLAYNKVLGERSLQSALGWRASIAVERQDQGAIVNVALHDKSGIAQRGLIVRAVLRRPTNAALDRALTLTETDAQYEGRVDALPTGQWDVIAQTTAANGVNFEATRRVVIK